MRDDPFIKDTPRKTLDMAGQPIEFPILYYDSRWINAIFTAKTSKLKKIFPHSNIKPIEMWPGRSMLGISTFEYRDSSIVLIMRSYSRSQSSFHPGLFSQVWQ